MFVPSLTLTFIMTLLALGAVAYHVQDGTIVYAAHDPARRIFPVRHPLPKSSITHTAEWIEPGKKTTIRLAAHAPHTIVTASIVDELNAPVIEARRAPHFTASVGGPVDAAFAASAFEVTATATAAATAFVVVDSMVPAPTEMVVGPVNAAMVASVVTPAAVVAPILPRLMPIFTASALGPIDPAFAADPPPKEVAEQEQEQIAAAGANKLGHRAVTVSEQEDGTLHDAANKIGPRNVPVTEQEDGTLRVAVDKLKARYMPFAEQKDVDLRVAHDRFERRHVPVTEHKDGTLRVAANKPEPRNAPVTEQEDRTLRVAANEPSRRQLLPPVNQDDADHHITRRCHDTQTSPTQPCQTVIPTTFASRPRSHSRASASGSSFSRASHGSHMPAPFSSYTLLHTVRFPTRPHNLDLHPTWTTTATYTALTRLDGYVIPRTWTAILSARDQDHGAGWQIISYVAALGTAIGPVKPSSTAAAAASTASATEVEEGRQTASLIRRDGIDGLDSWNDLSFPTWGIDKRDEDHGEGWQSASFVAASGTDIGPVVPTTLTTFAAATTITTTKVIEERQVPDEHNPLSQISHRILPSMVNSVGTPTGPMAPEMTRPHGRFGRFGDGVIDLMPKKEGAEEH